MPFKTIKPELPPIDMAELGERIAKRRTELGIPELPSRADDSVHPELVEGRTPSKRALLKAIEDAGGKW